MSYQWRTRKGWVKRFCLAVGALFFTVMFRNGGNSLQRITHQGGCGFQFVETFGDAKGFENCFSSSRQSVEFSVLSVSLCHKVTLA